jgi:hypothetical protein
MEVREPSELRLCGKKGARRYVIGTSLKYLSYSFSLQLVVVLALRCTELLPSLEVLIFPLGVQALMEQRFVRRGTLTVIVCAFQEVSARRPSRFQRR